MINIPHKLYKKNLRGAATLVIAVLLLVTATLIVVFAGSYSIMQQKISANQIRNQQAYEAAEAGLEFGINYLQLNSTTILATPSGGHILPYTSASTTNVTLSNNSRFSIVYTNPTANDYTLILITVTGTSDDGTASRVVQQLVKYGSVLFTPSHNAITTKGSVNISGNGKVTNTQYNSTVVSASAMTLNGNAKTITSTGTSSTPGNIQSDVEQNNAILSDMSVDDLFSAYFGAPMAQIKSTMGHVYSSAGSTNYSSILSGMTGTTIWIDQPSGSATLSGNTTIGSADNPVLIIVNGDLDISGNTTIYGFIFVAGSTAATTDITGNFNLTGGLATADSLNISGNVNVIYDSSALVGVQTSLPSTYYAKVPASWKDF
jgi:hypothetical protein